MNGFAKIWAIFLVGFLILIWTFVGWPRVWNNPQVPPKLKEARAAVCPTSPCSVTTAGSDTFVVPAYETLTVTVWGGGGGGGGAGTAGVTNGGDGGQSSFGSPTPVVANGGTGGTGDSTGGTSAGGGGGTASGGDTNTTGATGGTTASGATLGGVGGDAPNGGTGGTPVNKAAGGPGNAPGGGGAGGGYQSGGTKRAGGGGGSGGYSTKTFSAGELTESSSIDIVVGNLGNAGGASTGNLGGAGAVGQIDISWTEPAGNFAPTVSVVDVSPAPITLTENGTTTVTVTATISDDDGCDDVFTSGSIFAVLYRSGVSGAGSCSADANNCYRGITLTDVGSTCTGGADTQGDASGTVQVWYIAEATDASSTFSGETWQAEVIAADAANATSSAVDGSPPELSTLLAINVTASINYGTLTPNTTSTTQTVTITNTGNFNSTDANFSGVNLEDGGNSIVVTSQRYSTTTNEFWDYMDFTLDGTPTFRELNIAKGTATGTPSTQDHFWAIQIPNGTPVGTYNGTTTIEAQ